AKRRWRRRRRDVRRRAFGRGGRRRIGVLDLQWRHWRLLLGSRAHLRRGRRRRRERFRHGRRRRFGHGLDLDLRLWGRRSLQRGGRRRRRRHGAGRHDRRRRRKGGGLGRSLEQLWRGGVRERDRR